MSIPIEDRIIENGKVIESAGCYITTVTAGIPKAALFDEMEQKNYVMVGIPITETVGNRQASYINWKWIMPK